MSRKIYKSINGVVSLGENFIFGDFILSMIMHSAILVGSFFILYFITPINLVLGLFGFIMIFFKGAYNLANDYYLYYIQKNITELYIDSTSQKIIIKYKSKLNKDFELEIKFKDLIKIEEGNGSTYSIMSRLAYGKKITLYIEKTIYIFSRTQEITEEDYNELYKFLIEIVENNK